MIVIVKHNVEKQSLMGYAEDESNSVAAETSYQNRLQ
jgi:hypothetical protein